MPGERAQGKALSHVKKNAGNIKRKSRGKVCSLRKKVSRNEKTKKKEKEAATKCSKGGRTQKTKIQKVKKGAKGPLAGKGGSWRRGTAKPENRNS